ncbi:MAG: glutathione S-transferase N-terminal domain-containing protein [Acetobacteraceae bacterium]|nr:glutathione S-transferase N-terminal domain-containing protein [Acetobacteraceae bacterium]
MQLFVSPRSPFVREVLVAVCELGLAGSIKLIPAVVRMDQPNEAVLAVNPLGKIPALILPDGTPVSGTLPIIDEMDRRAGGHLLPTERSERSWHLRRQAVSHGLLDILVLWRNERDKPAPQQTPGWLANFARKAAGTLDALERGAAELGAAPFGLAHASLAALGFYLDFRFADLEWRRGRPDLAAEMASLAARPSVQEAAALCAAM